jgi:hypothetical protein
MTDFRALCAELADSIELLLEMRPDDAKPLRITEERLSRSRAALAEPQPKPPTDQELAKTAMQAVENYRFATELHYFLSEDSSEYEPLMLILRAVLARWGKYSDQLMTKQLPPPELVQQWLTEGRHQDYCSATEHAIEQAARWGADMELEACVEWVKYTHADDMTPDALRAARRPKPLTLKQQALAKLPEHPENMASHLKLTPGEVAAIRRALEALPDD